MKKKVQKKKARKSAPRRRRFRGVTFTADQRDEILMTMTEKQREAYAECIQLSFSDKVMNIVFEDAPMWKFTGIRVDYGWEYRKTDPIKSANLRCVCGRQLRYQYWLVSTDGRNRRVGLGSSHFMQHLDIPESVAREVFAKFNQVQRKMDEMLMFYRNGARFPRDNGVREFVLSTEFSSLNSVLARRLHGFAVADLPLMGSDLGKLRSMVSQLKSEPREKIQNSRPLIAARERNTVIRKAVAEPKNSVQLVAERKPKRKASRTHLQALEDSDSYSHERFEFDQQHAASLEELVEEVYQARQELEQSVPDSEEYRAAKVRLQKAQEQRNRLVYRPSTRTNPRRRYDTWENR